MSLQVQALPKIKSINNLQDNELLSRVNSSSGILRVNSSTNIANIPRVNSLPRIKSSSDIFFQEDEIPLIERQSSELINLSLKDFHIYENFRASYCCPNNKVDDISLKEQELELRKSMPILPSHTTKNEDPKDINYFNLIKDHIRNYRKLNERHLKYINKNLDSEQKMEIIGIYNLCVETLIKILEKN